jgi:hypothetical protein
MPEIPPMGFRFRVTFICVVCFMAGIVLPGCISYEFVRHVRGAEVMPPDNALKTGTTSLSEVLSVYGAPDKIETYGAHDLLIYQRIIYGYSGFAFSIPFGDLSFINPEISASGGLGRYDTLALFFSSDGVLREMVYTKGSRYPYLKTLFEEEGSAEDRSRGQPTKGNTTSEKSSLAPNRSIFP